MKPTGAQATIIAAGLSVLAAAITYYFTERAKLEAESYNRRSERYETLLSTVTAYQVSGDVAMRARFLAEFEQCWLYCPDSVIRAGYAFIDSVETGNTATTDERDAAIQALVLAIREDLVDGSRVRKTSMRADEYQILRVRP